MANQFYSHYSLTARTDLQPERAGSTMVITQGLPYLKCVDALETHRIELGAACNLWALD